ncbi:hypothetical protein [Alsobacter sp. SYSU BS001988]|jgi:hypothetical protein
MPRSDNPLRWLALGGLLALAGCQESLARRDAISFAAGDAIAYNKAVHIIDPWPAASVNPDIPTSGRRVADAIERYENHGLPDAGRLGGPAPGGPPVLAPVAVGP